MISVLLAIVAVVAALATLSVWKWLRKRRFKSAMRRARLLEKRTLGFLEEKGFRCLGEQVERASFFFLNGERIPFKVRADYLLGRRGKKYIVEVKTGKQSESPESPSVRRQLLEYALLFAPWPVLLVDGEKQRVYEVCFPGVTSLRNRWVWVLLFLLGFMVGRWSKGL
ncbi:MAG: hypothetical protein ACUVTO_04135 [Candidatus Caldatribacteriaceae bacterium]